jgi:hypothetical protein
VSTKPGQVQSRMAVRNLTPPVPGRVLSRAWAGQGIGGGGGAEPPGLAVFASSVSWRRARAFRRSARGVQTMPKGMPHHPRRRLCRSASCSGLVAGGGAYEGDCSPLREYQVARDFRQHQPERACACRTLGPSQGYPPTSSTVATSLFQADRPTSRSRVGSEPTGLRSDERTIIPGVTRCSMASAHSNSRSAANRRTDALSRSRRWKAGSLTDLR